MNNNNEEPIYYRAPDNTKYIIIGGVLIAIAGVGAYYIWSRQELINKALRMIEDMKLEYDEFMANDGMIDEWEGGILHSKERALDVIIKEIERKGLLGQFVDALWAIGIVVVIVTGARIFYEIVKRYLKRHPPPEAPPGEPYVHPLDGTTWPNPEPFIDHTIDEYGTPDPAYTNEIIDAWDAVDTLPEWIKDLINAVLGIPGAIGTAWGDLEPWQQNAILVTIIAALCIVVALTFGVTWPILGPVITAWRAIPVAG